AGEGTYRLLSDSVFNIYNLVTVVAVGRELGMSHDEIRRYLATMEIIGSRYNAEEVGKLTLVMQMAKDRNALACSRAFDYVSSQPGEKELLLMMNNLNDEKNWSENTSWLYDCDFEFLNRPGITHIICTGPRSGDYKLRLLLAGVPEEKIDCVKDELAAADALWLRPGTRVTMFYGTDSLALVYRVRDKIRRLAEEAAR
ncbi:MAG: MurT ligase domain-containing protein, partial [bacterium]